MEKWKVLKLGVRRKVLKWKTESVKVRNEELGGKKKDSEHVFALKGQPKTANGKVSLRTAPFANIKVGTHRVRPKIEDARKPKV